MAFFYKPLTSSSSAVHDRYTYENDHFKYFKSLRTLNFYFSRILRLTIRRAENLSVSYGLKYPSFRKLQKSVRGQWSKVRRFWLDIKLLSRIGAERIYINGRLNESPKSNFEKPELPERLDSVMSRPDWNLDFQITSENKTRLSTVLISQSLR